MGKYKSYDEYIQSDWYKKYTEKIKRLNWSGFVLVLSLTGAASFARNQDPSLLVSFYVWMILGLPISLLVLFIGIKPKDN
jgi:hypothetical protein